MVFIPFCGCGLRYYFDCSQIFATHFWVQPENFIPFYRNHHPTQISLPENSRNPVFQALLENSGKAKK